MSITATVEHDTIKLPVHIPDGTSVEIFVKEELNGSFLDTIRDLVGTAAGLPVDFAAEHDHYIHGAAKRSGK